MDYISDDKVFLIAEAGVNHDGELEKALALVDAALEAGADAVKFQTFKPGECTGKFAVKVDYLKKTSAEDESRFDLTKKLALPFEDFRRIQAYARQRGILFLTTPDGFESLDFVHRILNIPIIKISSTEVTHLPFLDQAARLQKPIILSTGMSTLDEVGAALDVIRKSNGQVYVLHCTSQYPTPLEDVNLKAMDTVRKALQVPVGYSDHTLGFETAIAAVAMGACIIEKHFTLDKNLPGPDHQMSLSPQELKDFVRAVRNTTLLLGHAEKQPTPGELKNIDGIRRSVVAARPLKKDTVITAEDITCKRPGYGIQPHELEKVIGLTLDRDMEEDEPFEWEYLR